MRTNQISVFLENRSGRLARVLATLSDAEIKIKAFMLADTLEYGVLRMVVDDWRKAMKCLKELEFTVSSTKVLKIEINENQRKIHDIFSSLYDAGINVEYMYGFEEENNNTVLIFKVDRIDKALAMFPVRNAH